MKRFDSAKWITENKYGKPQITQVKYDEQNIDSKNPDRDPFQDLYDKQNPNDPKAIPGKHFPNTMKKVINLKMDSEIGEPVTVEFTPGSNLKNVKISWGNESHTVDFEKGDFEDNYEHDMIAEFMAESDDMKWQFILDVVLPNNYEDSGTIDDILWDDLIVQSHPDDESHLDPEDRSDYDNGDELGSAMAEQGIDDRFKDAMSGAGFSDEEQDDVMSRDIGDDSFGSAGTDKRTQQVITDIIQLIKSTDIDPMDVMEVIGEEFKIKFEFSGGAPDPNSGLPKMDPDNWGFGDNNDDSINPGNTKDQDTKRKAYIKKFGDKSPGQR